MRCCSSARGSAASSTVRARRSATRAATRCHHVSPQHLTLGELLQLCQDSPQLLCRTPHAVEEPCNLVQLHVQVLGEFSAELALAELERRGALAA